MHPDADRGTAPCPYWCAYVLSRAAGRSGVRSGQLQAYALGVEACLWGRPLVELAITFTAVLKAGGSRVNGLRYFDDLKTAKERFVVTPNNVTIDG